MTTFPNQRYPLPQNIAEVRILNSENNTNYFINLYVDKAEDFFRFALANRKTALHPSPMPGVSGPATLALEMLFLNVPARFPLTDLIKFLRNEQKSFNNGEYPNPTMVFEEIEDALIRWYVQGGERPNAVTVTDDHQ
jgi:hypothetical protein